MVRQYKNLPGTRNYKNYSDETLEEALAKITDGDMTINAASLTYKIPFGTLYNKFKGMHGSMPGASPVFTYNEEISILKAAATYADWGFPLTDFDLRMFAKSYLEQRGKNVTRFTNNIPGIDWALSLLKRHKNGYGQRVATNIKRARAAVGRESINNYFDNLQGVLVDVPPSHIFNYDESNLSDDPGTKKCIYRRGVKYPEKVINHTKSCTSIMICGSASGTLLPPYVIYKSLHLYDTWKERGIVGYPCCTLPCCSRGSRYNRTASGWIDASTFKDWFITCFLPHADRLDGHKVLIGDNLSSHLDTDVLELCRSHNISFICLVPNSTHLCQPLDVSFFRPMKIAWRKILEELKLANPKASAVPKDIFPYLLKTCIIKMDKVQASKSTEEETTSAIQRNLISGFQATGIYPLNRQKVLSKIPDASESQAQTEAIVRDSLTEFLKEQRFGRTSEPTRKKKRLCVEPGKSISTVDEPETTTVSGLDEPGSSTLLGLDEPGPSTLSGLEEPEPFTLSGSNATRPSTLSGFVESIYDEEDNEATSCEEEVVESQAIVDNARPVSESGKFILAKFHTAKGKKTYHYVCMIDSQSENTLVVLGFKSPKKSKNVFKAVEDDVSIIDVCDIKYLPQPKFEDNLYIFPENIDVKEL